MEIDGELFDIAHRYFGLRSRPELREFAQDARPFLRAANDVRYDAIFLDTYRQPYIPFYLTTREFFRLARDRLAPGGAVLVNVGHPEGDQRLERVLSATMATAFPYVVRDPLKATNTVVIGSTAPVTAANLRAAAGAGRIPPELGSLALRTAARLAPRLRGGAVYTDDKAPVEWLVDRSIVEYAAGNEPGG